jgi:hypothetical protein
MKFYPIPQRAPSWKLGFLLMMGLVAMLSVVA